ncbi:hypothetical protein [Thorsellia kenyensis]|uniref:Uncharacterized protein n=1 Tax=Thorsellia kenyensis TaxID=1549888 RepID=A0ABV6CAE5_9GAMM
MQFIINPCGVIALLLNLELQETGLANAWRLSAAFLVRCEPMNVNFFLLVPARPSLVLVLLLSSTLSIWEVAELFYFQVVYQ